MVAPFATLDVTLHPRASNEERGIFHFRSIYIDIFLLSEENKFDMRELKVEDICKFLSTSFVCMYRKKQIISFA